MRGTKVQRDTVTAEGKEREDRLRRRYISNALNGKPHNSSNFLSNQHFPERANCVEKAAAERLREREMRE